MQLMLEQRYKTKSRLDKAVININAQIGTASGKLVKRTKTLVVAEERMQDPLMDLMVLEQLLHERQSAGMIRFEEAKRNNDYHDELVRFVFLFPQLNLVVF
jgi:hypothetical protein